MTVSTKLYGSLGALAAVGLIASGTGIWYLRLLGEELNTATKKTATKLDLVNATRARAWESVAALRGVYLFSNLNDQQALNESGKQWQDAFKRLGEQVGQLRPLLITEESKRDLSRFAADLEDYQRASVDYVALCRARNFQAIAALSPRIRTFAKTSDETLGKLRDQQREFLKASQARADTLKAQSLFINLLMCCTLVGISAVVVVVVRRVNRTLVEAAAELLDGADQVTSAAGQVSSASQSLAQGASELAASLEETSASSEEINAMSHKNSDNSQAAAKLVTESQQQFNLTNHSLEQTVTAMEEINGQSNKISKIIKVIDEIAFQTNILALNAAVEAARAGDAGLSFAVVADEVRNLAKRCAEAAGDTTSLIGESISRSLEGKCKVDEIVIAIRKLTAGAEKTKLLVDEVNLSSQEQSQGVERVAKALAQMDHVTQSTAASAEESASAAEELNAQSEGLKSVVRRLNEMIGGGAVRVALK